MTKFRKSMGSVQVEFRKENISRNPRWKKSKNFKEKVGKKMQKPEKFFQ